MADEYPSDDDKYANESFENDSETEIPEEPDQSDDNGEPEDMERINTTTTKTATIFTRKNLKGRDSLDRYNYMLYDSSSEDENDVVVSQTIAEINTEPMDLEEVANTPKPDSPGRHSNSSQVLWSQTAKSGSNVLDTSTTLTLNKDNKTDQTEDNEINGFVSDEVETDNDSGNDNVDGISTDEADDIDDAVNLEGVNNIDAMNDSDQAEHFAKVAAASQVFEDTDIESSTSQSEFEGFIETVKRQGQARPTNDNLQKHSIEVKANIVAREVDITFTSKLIRPGADTDNKLTDLTEELSESDESVNVGTAIERNQASSITVSVEQIEKCQSMTDVSTYTAQESSVYRQIDYEPKIEVRLQSATPSSMNTDDYLFHMNLIKKNGLHPPMDKNLRLKPMPRKSFSFTNERVREIERQNQILLRKILTQKPTYTSNPQKTKSKANLLTANRVTSAAVNRKKQQRQIDLDNDVLKRKIEAISIRRPIL